MAWPGTWQSTIPNVEDNELFYPVLYLWRRELPNSGGAGALPRRQRLRGRGDRPQTDRINWVTVAAEVAVPGPGLFGGYPTSTNRYQLLKGAGRARATSHAPARWSPALDELDGEIDWVGPRRSTASPDPTTSGCSHGRAAAATATRCERDPEDGRRATSPPAGSRRDWADAGLRRRASSARRRRAASTSAATRSAARGDHRRAAGRGPAVRRQHGGDCRRSRRRLTAGSASAWRSPGASSAPTACRWVRPAATTSSGALLRDLPLTEANPEVRDARDLRRPRGQLPPDHLS